MKLSPIDIQKQQFRKVWRGLERQEVHSFLELVAEQLGELARENNDLRADLRRSERELEEYRERETTLKEAMLTAQRAIDEIREVAEKEAQLTVTQAELRAEKLVFDAHKRVSAVLEDIQDLKRQRTRFREELRGTLRLHESLLDTEPMDEVKESVEGTVTVLEQIRAPKPPEDFDAAPASSNN